jgi:hypothetical protein
MEESVEQGEEERRRRFWGEAEKEGLRRLWLISQSSFSPSLPVNLSPSL